MCDDFLLSLLRTSAVEHHVTYQYYLKGAKNHYIGLAQTETPYYQPFPVPTAPFIEIHPWDPTQIPHGNAWAFTVEDSQGILVFGAPCPLRCLVHYLS